MCCFVISKIFGDFIYKCYCWLSNKILSSQYLKSALKTPQAAAYQLKNHSKKDPKSDLKNKVEKKKQQTYLEAECHAHRSLGNIN